MTRKKQKLITLEEESEDVADDVLIVEDVPVVEKRAMSVVNHDVLLPRSASRYVPQMR